MDALGGVMLVIALMVVVAASCAAGQPEKSDGKNPAAPSAPADGGGGGGGGANALKPAVPFPHPIITEVLYAVPSGAAGDANKDGKREVCGDEFVELVNPHDKPIQLFGYMLTDSQEPGKGQMKFTFPAMELPPGGVVVVFNGMNSTWAGPVGDSKTPPPTVTPVAAPTGADKAPGAEASKGLGGSGGPGKNDLFGGAWVFTMKNTNSKVALGNSGDQVLLSAPDNTPVQRVYWSEEGPKKEEDAAAEGGKDGAKPGASPTHPPVPAAAPSAAKGKPLLEDFAPLVTKCSVHRDSVYPTGRFVSHMDSEHAAFSPGVYVIVRPPEKVEEGKYKQ
jgi:hypothetical protein